MNNRTIIEAIPVDDQGRHLSLHVSHDTDRKCFHVSLWREHHDRGFTTMSIMEDSMLSGRVPVARFSAKKLQETFDNYRHFLEDAGAIEWAREKKI